jgi:hypothetical protein
MKMTIDRVTPGRGFGGRARLSGAAPLFGGGNEVKLLFGYAIKLLIDIDLKPFKLKLDSKHCCDCCQESCQKCITQTIFF